MIAQPGPPPPPRPDRIENILNLSAEQKSAWSAARKEFRSANEALFDKQRAAHDRLQDALEANAPDPCAVGTAMVAMHAIDEQVRSADEALHQKLEAILTAEQRAKLESMPRGPMGPPPAR